MDILSTILNPAFEEIRAGLPKASDVKFGPDVQLFGNNSAFDSLAFVSFLVLVEEQIYTQTGKAISLVDDKAFSLKNSPFQTIGSLGSYIKEKISNA